MEYIYQQTERFSWTVIRPAIHFSTTEQPRVWGTAQILSHWGFVSIRLLYNARDLFIFFPRMCVQYTVSADDLLSRTLILR